MCSRAARHLLFVEVYEFQNFDMIFLGSMLMCLCRVSSLTTLDINKAYFRGRHIREYKGQHMKKVTDALFSQKEATASLHLRVL